MSTDFCGHRVEFICDPTCAIDALQEAIAKTGKPHVLRYKVYSRTRFYYVEPYVEEGIADEH